MNETVLPEAATITFADFFKVAAEVEDILASFGYSYRFRSCILNRHEIDREHLAEVKSRLEEFLPHTSLTSEVARREFLIAPVLMEVVRQTGAKIKVEYALEVNERLKGTLDYFLRATHNMLVVEAKQGDLQKGFKQLAVELVALDQWAADAPESRLYGAVSTGDVWKFGYLERARKRVIEDINTYSVPTNMRDVVEILVGILVD